MFMRTHTFKSSLSECSVSFAAAFSSASTVLDADVLSPVPLLACLAPPRGTCLLRFFTNLDFWLTLSSSLGGRSRRCLSSFPCLWKAAFQVSNSNSNRSKRTTCASARRTHEGFKYTVGTIMTLCGLQIPTPLSLPSFTYKQRRTSARRSPHTYLWNPAEHVG
ncbi:hypothetical protein DL96DRAFT_1615334 [Flagelloscypha sp. PMI_526]|nr:hypothetical protein DL96DRAFT_1615334 [Flagelloscypha sp. PMI_526]